MICVSHEIDWLIVRAFFLRVEICTSVQKDSTNKLGSGVAGI